MTIHRDHGLIVFECDTCDETLETDEEDFDTAYRDAKDKGWKAKKVGDEWEHQCPDCVHEENIA